MGGDACYPWRVSFRGLAMLCMFLAVTAVAVGSAAEREVASDECAEWVEAERGEATHEAGDGCPPTCPPGCDDTCTCCTSVRADMVASLTTVAAPAAGRVAYVRATQPAPSSAELEERDAVPRVSFSAL